MPDWRCLVEQRLRRLRLPSQLRDEVWTELAQHLEDVYEQFVNAGISAEEAQPRTLESISEWKHLQRGIEREKRGSMSKFGKQVILPSGLAFAMASIALAVEMRLGPRPIVWTFPTGALVMYRIWPIALLITGAVSAYLSMRGGANKGRRAWVAITPALYMLLVMLSVVAIVLAGHWLNLLPAQPIYWWAFLTGVVNWVVIPAIALLLGAVPFCGRSVEQSQVSA